jgi:hypothetical protein
VRIIRAAIEEIQATRTHTAANRQPAGLDALC